MAFTPSATVEPRKMREPPEGEERKEKGTKRERKGKEKERLGFATKDRK